MVHQKTAKAKQQHKLYEKLHALRVKKTNNQKISEPQTMPSLQGVLGIQSLLREIELKLKRH